MPTTPNFSQPAIFSQVSTPTVPDSGYIKVYGKSDVLCSIASGGSEQSYLTSSGAAANYLPLAGGTLTGPITGSSNVIEQRNSTNAQELRIYNTYTSATSYERIEIKGKASANFEIGPENGSAGGTLRGLTIGGYSAGSSTITPWMSFTGSTGELGLFGNGIVRQSKYGDDATAAIYAFRKYRGTEASPTALNSGDTIAQILIQGYHGSTIGTSAAIQMVATEAFTASPVNRPTRMHFNTTGPLDTQSSIRMTISDSGDVGIGTTTVSARTHVVSTTEQLRIGYDLSNYYSTTVGSTGAVTFNSVGAGSAFTFSDAVTCSSTLAVTGATTFNNSVIAESANVFIRTASLYFDSYGTHNGIRNRRANGTLALPTQVIAGDLLAFWNAVGYHNGGAFHTNATTGISMYASENFTSTACGGNIRFTTTPIASATAVLRMLVDEDGRVAIGGNNVSPACLLHLLSTTEQLRIGYDTGDYYSTTVSSTGAVTFDAVGSAPLFAFSKLVGQSAAEITNTPAATSQTITLNNGNHQTLTLTSATGTVAVTLTVPSKVSSGTIIVKQHAATPRNITWAVSAGTIKWMGTQPTWSSDAVNAIRLVSWRYDGSVMYLMSTDTGV